MRKHCLFVLLLCLFSVACQRLEDSISELEHAEQMSMGNAGNGDISSIRGALLLTRFTSLDEFKKVVKVEYFRANPHSPYVTLDRPMVRLTYKSSGRTVQSILAPDVNESDFSKARDGDWWDKIQLGLNSPYTAIYHQDLQRVALLARWRFVYFGEGDIAFYDLAKTMVDHISADDLPYISERDLSEKGFLNTFNHITAQAMMTSLFSEKFADFIADSHERYKIPELMSGDFSKEQVEDIDFGAVDNYVDIINNEWGQELGKELKKRYHIDRETIWTAEVLAAYLNDILAYYSWALQISFEPFHASDDLVIRFTKKINIVMGDISEMQR